MATAPAPPKVLAETDIYTTPDGSNRINMVLTGESPCPESVQQLYAVLDYIPTLNKVFRVTIDTRAVSTTDYIGFLPDMLKAMAERSGDCISDAEVVLSKATAFLVIPLLQPLLDTVLCSQKVTLKSG